MIGKDTTTTEKHEGINNAIIQLNDRVASLQNLSARIDGNPQGCATAASDKPDISLEYVLDTAESRLVDLGNQIQELISGITAKLWGG